jgi:hypothetical protein
MEAYLLVRRGFGLVVDRDREVELKEARSSWKANM